MTLPRLNKLILKLAAQPYDALLVFQRANIRYLTGFSGSTSYLLVSGGACVLYVDSRYIERAQSEVCKGVKIRLFSSSYIDNLLQDLKDLNIARLGIEAQHISWSDAVRLKDKLSQIVVVPSVMLVESVRAVKDQEEVRLIKSSISLLKEGFERIKGLLDGKDTLRERDAALLAQYYMLQRGGSSMAFDTIVAAGSKSSMPHALTGDAVCAGQGAENDVVLVDMGVVKEGYCSDVTRTFFLKREKSGKEIENVMQIVRGAQRRAIDAVRPGVLARGVDSAAREYIAQAGYGENFGHGLGHGIGLEVHEHPYLNSFKGDTVLEEGMVFTIEPGIYLPGKFGVRHEDMVLVTKEGCEVLTSSLDSIPLELG